jgi:hypothetical protein
MQHKKTDILAYLVDVYKDFYTHKELFRLNFKYSPNDIEDFYKQFQDSIADRTGEKSASKEPVRADILALKTVDDVKGYLVKYRSGGTLAKDVLIKELNLEEFDYLYEIIYKSPLKSSMRKADALNSIEKYFNGISRAVSMKP